MSASGNVIRKVQDSNMPLYAFGSLVVFVAAFLTLDLSGHGSDGPMFFALMISTVPSFVAALFAERSSRDIRNGVVESKVKKGATQAIDESGAADAAAEAVNAASENVKAIDTLTKMLQDHLDKEGKKP